jgi:hypothetical protein
MSDEVTSSLLDKERSVIIPSSRDQVRPSDLSQQPTPWILVTMLSETNDHCDIIAIALFAPPNRESCTQLLNLTRLVCSYVSPEPSK